MIENIYLMLYLYCKYYKYIILNKIKGSLKISAKNQYHTPVSLRKGRRTIFKKAF